VQWHELKPWWKKRTVNAIILLAWYYAVEKFVLPSEGKVTNYNSVIFLAVAKI
jgi:hypothetical protein